MLSSIIGILAVGFSIATGHVGSYSDAVSWSLNNVNQVRETYGYLTCDANGNSALLSQSRSVSMSSITQDTTQAYVLNLNIGYPFVDNISDKSFFEYHIELNINIGYQSTTTYSFKEIYFKRTRANQYKDVALAYDLPSNLYVTISSTFVGTSTGGSSAGIIYSLNRTFNMSQLPNDWASPISTTGIINTPSALVGGTWYQSLTFTDSLPDYTQAFNNGYNAGVLAGRAEGLESQFTFSNYLFAIADTPVIFLRSLFDYELFGGPSIFVVLLSLITLVIVLGLIRRFI